MRSAEPAVSASVLRARPYYLPVGNEVQVFESAYAQRLPMLLVGPTGTGKTRFLEYMTWSLSAARRSAGEEPLRLYTVACHEDMSAADLTGRFLLVGGETVWRDGPLAQAAREPSICYLDELVEARTDTTVVIHSLTDYRRRLPIAQLGVEIVAHPDFLLVASMNPGYAVYAKELKPSTRQRFVTIRFTYLPVDGEAQVLSHESGLDTDSCIRLARLASSLRELEGAELLAAPSTRLLVYTAQLHANGMTLAEACDAALLNSLTDDEDARAALRDVVSSFI